MPKVQIKTPGLGLVSGRYRAMRVSGLVRHSHQDRAWGIIATDDGATYRFLIDGQRERLMEGDRVKFSLRKTSESGLIAENVERTGAACQVS